jgi:hypothetical protein
MDRCGGTATITRRIGAPNDGSIIILEYLLQADSALFIQMQIAFKYACLAASEDDLTRSLCVE